MMSKEQCVSCEYDESCWGALKLKNRLSSDPCGNFRKRRVVAQKILTGTTVQVPPKQEDPMK